MVDRSPTPTGTDGDDQLSQRFKALFNKDPVSKPTTQDPSSSWKAKDLQDYVVDDEEVPSTPGQRLC
jgi:hypothetical protein